MQNGTQLLLRQFKALGDLQRMRVMSLCQHGECSVTELSCVLGLSQPRVSQHLKQLCEAGLLERFPDGKRVYYRIRGRKGGNHRHLLALIPGNEPRFQEDAARLREQRGGDLAQAGHDAAIDDPQYRSIQRAILEQTITTPIGDLLDIGCGRGRILKLLASRAHRAIGVDIDSDAREIARAELLLAGLANCSLRAGDMYRLPFDDAEFDTIILDEVLVGAEFPARVLLEAKRLLKPNGRLFVLLDLTSEQPAEIQEHLAGWCVAAGLRLAPSRLVPKAKPRWLLSVASSADSDSIAA